MMYHVYHKIYLFVVYQKVDCCGQNNDTETATEINFICSNYPSAQKDANMIQIPLYSRWC